MPKLRRLCIVTGNIRVEGGETSRVRGSTKRRGRSDRMTITSYMQIKPERKAGNVVATNFVRRLNRLTLCRTPFGSLIDPMRLPEVKSMISSAEEKVREFNAKAKGCKLWNCFVCEILGGARLVAVEHWLADQNRPGENGVVPDREKLYVAREEETQCEPRELTFPTTSR